MCTRRALSAGLLQPSRTKRWLQVLHRRRRRHQADPGHRPDHAVPRSRRLLAGRELGGHRAAAAGQRPGSAAVAAADARSAATRRHPGGGSRDRHPGRDDPPARPRSSALLFAALLVNINLVQVTRANDLGRPAGQQPRPHQGVRDPARPHPRRRRAGGAVGGHRRPAEVPARRTRTARCTRPPPASPRWSTGAPRIERIEDAVLAGTDPRFSLQQLADLIAGRTTKGGSVGAHAEPQGAGGRRQRA